MAHADDHDDDRFGPTCPALLPAFLFCFIRPFMPTSTPIFHRNALPAICHTSYYPRPILVFHLHHLFSSHFSSTFRPSEYRHYLSRLLPFSRSAAHLRRYSSISTTTEKNLQSRSLPSLPSFFASQHAHMHLLRSHIYVSITPGGIYLAPKRRILFVKGGARGPLKKPFVVSKYFIVVPSTRTIITFIKTAFLVPKSRI